MEQLPLTLHQKNIAASVAALLPPDVEGVEVQAEALATVGLRDEAPIKRHIPTPDGSDTLLSSHAPTLVWMPSLRASAWVLPLADERDHLSGVIVSIGGQQRGARWFRFADTSPTWSAILERLQRAGTGDGIGRDPRATGEVRIVPLSDGRAVAVQTFYGWPANGPPYVNRVAVAIGDSIRAAPSMAATVGAPVSSGPAPVTADARQERIRGLYDEMRVALQRGDWRAFGAAFDALGALLRRND
jgi:hypothetical protein